MAISRERKVELVAEYAEQIKASKGFILTDYRGLSVGEMTEIRRAMRPVDAEFRVVKNRLLSLAAEELDLSLPEDWLRGPTAIGFCHDEVRPVAKALTDAIKEFETLSIKGGVLDMVVVSSEQVQAIASLPSRDVLMAQVLGTINAPAGRVAGVVASGVRQVLNVLQAYVDKLEQSGAGMEQAAEPA